MTRKQPITIQGECQVISITQRPLTPEELKADIQRQFRLHQQRVRQNWQSRSENFHWNYRRQADAFRQKWPL